tara:strand:+ start:5726 stop:6799 length:1074 start_codon:yes stop_codon:yes gene_type:complete
MATSGTVQTSTIQVQEIIDTAYRRSTISSGQITAEMQDIGSFQLYTLLSALPNRGRLLWTIERPLLALVPKRQKYTLPVGTVDIDKLFYRTVTRESGGTPATSASGTAANAFDGDVDTACTQTSTNGNISYDFGSGNTPSVAFVGIMANGTATLDLVFESSTDNAAWSTVLNTASASYTDEIFTWYDIFLSKPARYFRVRETNGGTLNLSEVVFSAVINDKELSRQSQDIYSQQVAKLSLGEPNQYWVDRLYATTDIYVWPVGANQFNCFAGWTRRHIEDVGALSNELEIPSRWIDAITWGLSWRVNMELPIEVRPPDPALREFLFNMQQQKAGEAFDEERDNSPIQIAPRIGVYTA